MLFLFKFNQESIEKLIFSAFGKILVLVNAFSIEILIKKSIENVFFSSFWQDFGFGECFLFNF